MTDQPHQCFTVSSSAYLRSLDEDDRRGGCVAVHYQAPPEDVGDGMRRISLRWPFLVVSLYAKDSSAQAEKVARILNACWDDPRFADPAEGAQA